MQLVTRSRRPPAALSPLVVLVCRKWGPSRALAAPLSHSSPPNLASLRESSAPVASVLWLTCAIAVGVMAGLVTLALSPVAPIRRTSVGKVCLLPVHTLGQSQETSFLSPGVLAQHCHSRSPLVAPILVPGLPSTPR
uniref:Uncharacterized protein n=1 Tax=Ixodes ricinus TaxID=34613 RepID=A0A6B0USD2_IXORI